MYRRRLIALLAAGCGVEVDHTSPCTALGPDPRPVVRGDAFTVPLRCDVTHLRAVAWAVDLDLATNPFAPRLPATATVAGDQVTLAGVLPAGDPGVGRATIVAIDLAGPYDEPIVTETWQITAAGAP